MKAQKTLVALVAAALLTGQFAFAQGDVYPTPQGRYDQRQRGDTQDRRDRNNDGRPDNRRNQNQNQFQNQRPGYGNDQRYERGAGPDHNYHRGSRMPYQYRTRQYVVEDWRGHRLSAPPRGYQWVQTGGDYVLVAIATGIILQMLLNN